MRFPWSKPDDSEENMPENTDNQDEEVQEEPQEDTLEDLDEEVLTRVNAKLAKERESFDSRLTQARESARQYGFDFTEDQRLTISDPQLVQTHLSPLFTQPPAPQKPQAQEEAEEEWMDPSLDPEAFTRKLNKTIQAAIEPYKAENARLQQATQLTGIDAAVGRAKAAVSQMMPYMAPVMEHPEFEARCREAISMLPVEQWHDPELLASAVGMITPKLRMTQPMLDRQPERPTRNPQETARNAANRVSLTQTAPSRGGGSPPREDRYNEDERHLAQISGMTVEMWRSLEQDNTLPDGEDPYRKYRDVRDKERQANPRQRPTVRRG